LNSRKYRLFITVNAKTFLEWHQLFPPQRSQTLLPDRTKQLAGKFGFYYSMVKIQSSKSRWGSCSRERSINLSFYLMLLPSHLIDYVILHELCHTKEMNHSEKFWKWMDKVTDGQSKELRAELKNIVCRLE